MSVAAAAAIGAAAPAAALDVGEYTFDDLGLASTVIYSADSYLYGGPSATSVETAIVGGDLSSYVFSDVTGDEIQLSFGDQQIVNAEGDDIFVVEIGAFADPVGVSLSLGEPVGTIETLGTGQTVQSTDPDGNFFEYEVNVGTYDLSDLGLAEGEIIDSIVLVTLIEGQDFAAAIAAVGGINLYVAPPPPPPPPQEYTDKHPNNGHGNDLDGNDNSNPGRSNDPTDVTDSDMPPGRPGNSPGERTGFGQKGGPVPVTATAGDPTAETRGQTRRRSGFFGLDLRPNPSAPGSSAVGSGPGRSGDAPGLSGNRGGPKGNNRGGNGRGHGRDNNPGRGHGRG